MSTPVLTFRQLFRRAMSGGTLWLLASSSRARGARPNAISALPWALSRYLKAP